VSNVCLANLRLIALQNYNRNNIKAFVFLDILIALGLMAIFLVIIYNLKLQNIDRVENINNILVRERAIRNFLVVEPNIIDLNWPIDFHENWSVRHINNDEVIFISLEKNEYIYSLKRQP